MFNYLKTKMIIFEVIGGLGNQMFQYAAARSLSLRKRVSLRLDISSFEGYRLHQGFELGRIFNMPIEVTERRDLKRVLGWRYPSIIRRFLTRSDLELLRGRNFIIEPYFNYWQGIDNVSNDCYLTGYWQSERYFIDYSDQIRQDFSFKLPLNQKNLLLEHQINQVNAISLHIRRGDYVNNPKAAEVHGLCTLDYYDSAVKYISENVKYPYFFIFSDDIQWTRNNLKVPFPHQFVDHNYGVESYIDMRLMSMCNHHIVANSSFSWWGAWLNSSKNKIVITPSRWFANENKTLDLIPKGWLKL